MQPQRDDPDRTPGQPPRPARLSQALVPTGADIPSFAVRVTVAVLITLLLLFVVWMAWQGIKTLLEVFAGALFALFLQTLSERVQKWTGMAYGRALAVVLVVLVLATAGLTWLLASRVYEQVVGLTDQLPQSVEQLRKMAKETPAGAWALEQLPKATASLTGPEARPPVTGLLTGVMDFCIGVLVILFVGIFGAAEPALYRVRFSLISKVSNGGPCRTRSYGKGS